MRILLLANKLPYPPKDGGSIATLNMLTGLTDSGNEVTCLALNTAKHSFPVEQIPSSLTERIRFIGIACDSSIKPFRLILNLFLSGKPYIAERFNNREFGEKLSRLLEEESFDLIQLEGPYSGHYLNVIRAKSRARIAFRAHNVEHQIWKRKAANEKNLIRRWYLSNLAARLRRYELDVLRQSDFLVAISPLDEAYFREHVRGKPAITIPTGFSLESYPASPLPAEPSLFFIGALDWLPNQEGLMWFLDHVFGPLCDEIPGVRFHVAGRNAPEYIEKLLLKDNIVYHGEVEEAKMFMQSYRIMVAPLFTGSGIRIKILEAMALGRPVVTTSIGIEGIPAETNREVMVADDAQSFKDHIIHLISDNAVTSKLVGNGKKLIQENFDTFGLSTRLSRFFKEQV